MNNVLVNGKFLSEEEWDKIYKKVREKAKQKEEQYNNPPACPSDVSCSLINSMLDLSNEEEEKLRKEEIRIIKREIKLLNLIRISKKDDMLKDCKRIQDRYKEEDKRYDNVISEYQAQLKKLEN